MSRIAIFASGTGSNFDAIKAAIDRNELQAEIALIVCDKPGAKVVEKAENAGIDVFQFTPKTYASKQAFETEIVKELHAKGVNLVVLAGYMRLVGDTLLAAYGGKIVNIHPSLLPAFPGKDAIGQAIEAGVKVSGVTIHYVDEGMDTGPIIAQESMKLSTDDSYEEVQQRIQAIEHSLYPKVIANVLKEATA
ncbi:phosphoribosylglycinamide formyltransferase [Aureibacillus halotolerans]|uniref:Phosphoribosylglycinamide formyltransferase n=1 Tax=Aureibacillus halotolerans TaxID=1508390 RepID=A0A4R6TPQ5_9BACI|nr:phosphoribosylglycinamide formyltransferase [Aureibacillus halotolerans]TDQ34151.1 formyltetrahydrofolate-dependent phosphoribosylglycinamide formyltransferase [Aureibacillus halotolerans]